MDTPKNRKPFIWCTWITGLLAGSARCEWAPWYKAHFNYQKRETENFDLDAWRANHDKVVSIRAAELRAEGYVVGVEEDNSFVVKGERGLLAGKPDLILFMGTSVRVRDIKTGKERESDHWQVRIYQYGIPKVTPNLRGRTIGGELEYGGGRIVSVAGPTVTDIAKIGAAMQLVCGDLEPPKTPSRYECNRCDIAVCPVRNTEPPLEGETSDF